jgi:TatD DNase family protein
LAVEFSDKHDDCYASVGVHPHDGAGFMRDTKNRDLLEQLVSENRKRIVAIGECGLDYFYENSEKADQIKLLRLQLDLAQRYDLPVIFHVREAFEDFWPIIDEYRGIRGVVHSFTGNSEDVKQILRRNLYVGLNGIMTFTKHGSQLEAAKKIPLDRLLIETDAPFLTPKPFRGKICKPEHVKVTAEFLAELRGETLEDMARETTKNACYLFGIKS